LQIIVGEVRKGGVRQVSMELNDEVLGMTSRTNGTSLFVLVDESGASRHTLQYVGALVGKRRGFRIVLGYVLPPLPTELLAMALRA